MALNYLDTENSEKICNHGCSIEVCPHKHLDTSSGDCFKFWWESENSWDENKGKTEKESDDIVDLWPSDPFGMDMTATVTALTGWLEDFDRDFGLKTLGYVTDEIKVKDGVDQLFAGMNLVSTVCPELGGDMETTLKPIGCAMDRRGGLGDGDVGDPPDAFFYVLGYLGVSDLLSVQGVCKSLSDAVRNDPLLWRRIDIDVPSSFRITDDILLQLTSRAQGNLQCLSLVHCFMITDSGLKLVLERNPGLTKLSVPGCVRLSVEGILCNLKEVCKSAGRPGIKRLRIGARHDIENKHFEEFKLLLGAGKHEQLRARKPRFYHTGQMFLSIDDDRVIDIETCPRCQKLGELYDCPAESCQGKQHHGTQSCRACTLCVGRCISCGHCINGLEYEETFYLKMICLDCCKKLLNCQEEEMSTPTLKQTVVHHQQVSYSVSSL